MPFAVTTLDEQPIIFINEKNSIIQTSLPCLQAENRSKNNALLYISYDLYSLIFLLAWDLKKETIF